MSAIRVPTLATAMVAALIALPQSSGTSAHAAGRATASAIVHASAGATARTTVTVSVGAHGSPVNRRLVGFVFHFGAQPPAVIAPLHPHFVRIDAALQKLSPAPGILRMAALQAQVAALRKIGAEPLVILDYTPAWLGQAVAPLGDRTHTEPSDLRAWTALVERVVASLATGPGRVRWFEAWNEPDLPTYWDGTPTGWLDTAAASARAVHAAALRTGLPLRFGGPASFFPDGPQIAAFVSRLRAEGLPPAFVSWHYYANYPCLGPDGPENPGDPSSVALQRALGCVNPAASPSTYTPGIATVRAAVASASGAGPRPQLILDEWNLSAGGLDRRMSTNVGAAFDAGTLITFQEDGLAAATFYEATDTDPRPGGWGTVTKAGGRRPSWSVFRFWQELAPRTVAVRGADPASGFWALASGTAHRRRVTVLLASFSVAHPTGRMITLELRGLPRGVRSWRATVERIDAGHGGGATSPVGAVRQGRLNIVLPAQAVALVTINAGASARHPPGASRERRTGVT